MPERGQEKDGNSFPLCGPRTQDAAANKPQLSTKPRPVALSRYGTQMSANPEALELLQECGLVQPLWKTV